MPAAEGLSGRLPKKFRTEEELRELKRIDIRTIAVDHFGMDTKLASKTSTNDAIAFILEAQEKELGKGKGKAAPAAKGKDGVKGKAGKKPEPEPEPEAEPEPEPEEVEGEEAAPAGDLEEKVDFLGKALDSSVEELKAVLDGMANTLAEIQKSQFKLYGLVSNLFLISEGEDALEARDKELEEAWAAEQEGNG